MTMYRIIIFMFIVYIFISVTVNGNRINDINTTVNTIQTYVQVATEDVDDLDNDLAERIIK